MSLRSRDVLLFCLVLTVAVAFTSRSPGAEKPFRPPSVPLVTHDPYFSIWSGADRLTDVWPSHWTGRPHALYSMIRIDGKPYRVMGPVPADRVTMEQESVEALPTRTIYTFRTSEARVTLTFLTPALPDDLEILSRPVTYLTWDVRSADGKPHDVSIYYDNTAELAVNTPDQHVVWSREKVESLDVLRMGSADQQILAKKGDDLRIDWGHAYAAAPKGTSRQAIAPAAVRDAFAGGEPLPDADDSQMPRAARDGWPVCAFVFDLGKVGRETVSRTLLLAYDDVYSILYFTHRLRPYWRRNGAGAADILEAAWRGYSSLRKRCEAFDRELVADLERAGGVRYARMASLAYRQCLAGNKLVADRNGEPLFFPKENNSNGCIGTVDVTYPMAPLFLLFGSGLAKATLVPILDYAGSPRWKFPFAPHDLGTYPHATGQVYGGGEKSERNQMPVEESANLLLLVAAVSRLDGNADFAARYLPLLTRWAEYLGEKGLDPENQLCTDDFAGHLAHNVNLSAKAILALGAYAQICEPLGRKDDAAAYRRTAEGFAAKWIEKASDGDHCRLAFDRPGTWSQKYNLVWDRILGLDLFPPEVAGREVAFYRKVQKRYGLPLDNRKDFTKLDWIVWTGTLTGRRDDFEAIIGPACDFLDESPNRVPMSDWYWTTDAKVVGFRARPVIGGVFIKLLDDPVVWKKWAGRGAKTPGRWAPFPE